MIDTYVYVHSIDRRSTSSSEQVAICLCLVPPDTIQRNLHGLFAPDAVDGNLRVHEFGIVLIFGEPGPREALGQQPKQMLLPAQ